ncbi:MAG TPA: glutamate--tRNA ligase [Vicinamibacterales bacterium]|nr:glutamate--tRNA ligase [Vicinamibacterales bacterium]
MRLRFAPSPTGQLHVGNARTALFNWLLARGSSGAFVLRIEDTDVERSTRESEAAILTDLRWLGLDWDEGPDIGGPHGPYRQSERLPLYAEHAQRLLEAGTAYYCFCTPEALETARRRALAEGRPARYSGTCRYLASEEVGRRLASGERAAVRFRVPEGREVAFRDLVRGEIRFETAVIGDPVLLRTDGHPAYNFAVVVDDVLMGITHVVRGEDHISNTPRQVLLYEALGFDPPQFAHLSLVMGPDHTPLSKRHGATSVAEFRRKGYLPEALVNYLALIGWSPSGDEELLSVGEMARRFSLDAVGHSAGVFDEGKLAWVNRHYLRSADPRRIAELAVPYFRDAGVDLRPDAAGLAFLAGAMAMATGSVDRLEEIPPRLHFLFDYDAAAAVRRPAVREVVEAAGGREVVLALAEELAAEPRLDRERFRAVAARVRQRTGRKAAALFHPIRAALTGDAGGPELDLAVPAIDAGAGLPAGSGVPAILGCRERAAAFAQAIEEEPGRAPA